MISCPNCQHQELDGALYCSQCGTQLFQSGDTTAIYAAGFQASEGISSSSPPTFPPPPSDAVGSKIAVYLIDANQVVFFSGDSNLTIGRATEGQMVVPDIDLTPYKGYEGGVSRLHANLGIRGTQVTVKDLGSANGTRINGKRIAAHAEHALDHGDILTLGKIKLQLLLKE